MILDSFRQDVRVGLRVLFKEKSFCFLAVLVLANVYLETGKRPDIIPIATPVQVGVGQILALTENGYTSVRP